MSGGGSKRCPVCRRSMPEYLGDSMCDKCVSEKGDRKCERCHGKLSRWNSGKFCNPCWSSLSIKRRENVLKRSGYALEAYNPTKDLKREYRIDEIAKEPIEVADEKRRRKNVKRKDLHALNKESVEPPNPVDIPDEDA